MQYDLYKKTRIEKDDVTDLDREQERKGVDKVGKTVLGIKINILSDVQHHCFMILLLQRHYIQTLHLACVFIPFQIKLFKLNRLSLI